MPGRSGLPAAVELARKIAPLAQGEVAALTMATSAAAAPGPRLRGRRRASRRKLSDWRGRTVLVNLWATWCVPCRKEMPALDSLQAKLGGKDFEVVAINIDTRDPRQAEEFPEGRQSDQARLFQRPESQGFSGS